MNERFTHCALCGEKYLWPSKYKFCWSCYKKQPGDKIKALYEKDLNEEQKLEVIQLIRQDID